MPGSHDGDNHARAHRPRTSCDMEAHPREQSSMINERIAKGNGLIIDAPA